MEKPAEKVTTDRSGDQDLSVSIEEVAIESEGDHVPDFVRVKYTDRENSVVGYTRVVILSD